MRNMGAPLGTYPADGFDKVMDTNVRGPSLLTQAVLPALEQAATSQDPARVVMIGSVDGLAVLPVDGGSVTLR